MRQRFGRRRREGPAYYAGPGNQFWPTLHTVGFTPRQLAPAEYPLLVEFGVGLTDVCKVSAGSDRAVGTGELDVERLVALVERHRPAVVAFNGKKAAQAVLSRPVSYGPQKERVGEARVFVLPSTSGAARGFWDQRPWRQLAEACGSLPPAPTP